MYLPQTFSTEDPQALDRLVDYSAFGTLVSQLGGAPFASHLPALYRRADGRVTLTGHWARANPQWREIEGQRVLFIFQGPHAYISPRWYLDPEKNVPTWNYAVAHVYGQVRVIHDVTELERIVTSLAAKYEAGAQAPWRLDDTGEAGRGRLRAIVGFELAAEQVQVKVKLGQNQVEGNVAGAIAGLRAVGSAEAVETAAWMQGALDGRKDAST
jgi:transcriptional regulator